MCNCKVKTCILKMNLIINQKLGHLSFSFNDLFIYRTCMYKNNNKFIQYKTYYNQLESCLGYTVSMFSVIQLFQRPTNVLMIEARNPANYGSSPNLKIKIKLLKFWIRFCVISSFSRKLVYNQSLFLKYKMYYILT